MANLNLARSAAAHFEFKIRYTDTIIGKVTPAVSSWREYARRSGMHTEDIAVYAADNHEDCR